MADSLPITPFPPLPNRKDIAHLSEFERMVQGLPYKPYCDELSVIKKRCRDLLAQFNKLPLEEEEARRDLLAQIFHPSCKDKRNLIVKPGLRCSIGTNIKFGHCFFVNNDCILYDAAPIEFGDDCMLGPGVHIYTPSHPLDAAYRRLDDKKNYFETALAVKVGNDCWLGGGCILCPGVTLGNNVVVGAGAVVTKSFPDNVVIGGNPAKVIKRLPEPTLPTSGFWDDDDETD